MSGNTYQVIEIVGTSTTDISDARAFTDQTEHDGLGGGVVVVA